MSNLGFLFNPTSIALVGISASDPFQPTRFAFLLAHVEQFKGKLYVVHPKGTREDFMGVDVYPSLADIPGPVDYVISTVSRERTPQVATESTAKGVKAMLVYTAGYSESGDKEGIEAERELVRICREGNVRLVGPNSMGIYCPKSGMSFGPDVSTEAGSIGFIGQSGGFLMRSGALMPQHGVRFSKIISYGNAADLNECDYVEYLTQDPDTKIIGAYIEGTKEPRRFLKVLAEAAAAKPTIIVKGGLTQAGSRAAASHTASLAGSKEVWEAAIRQTGAIQVADLDELEDMFLTFQFVPPPKGRRMVVLGTGGGNGVFAADDCDREGFVLPPFDAAMREKLGGAKFTNPMDNVLLFGYKVGLGLLQALSRMDEFDCMLAYLSADVVPQSVDTVQHGLGRTLDAVIDFAKESPKPFLLVVTPTYIEFGLKEKAWNSGVLANYITTARATKALNRMMSYYEMKAQRQA